MSAATFLAVERRGRDHFGHIEQVAEFPGVQQFGVEDLARIAHSDVLEALPAIR